MYLQLVNMQHQVQLKIFYEQIITVLNIILGYCLHDLLVLNFVLDILLDYLGSACTDLAMFQLALSRIKEQKVCISEY